MKEDKPIYYIIERRNIKTGWWIWSKVLGMFCVIKCIPYTEYGKDHIRKEIVFTTLSLDTAMIELKLWKINENTCGCGLSKTCY